MHVMRMNIKGINKHKQQKYMYKVYAKGKYVHVIKVEKGGLKSYYLLGLEKGIQIVKGVLSL